MKEVIHESHFVQYADGELTAADAELVQCAREAAAGSYAPYSHFHVGAALRLSDGTVVKGCNQENAAFPSGLCAERTALFSAGAQHPDKAVTALAIAACDDHGTFTREPISPCGACRQVMLETEQRHGVPMRILLYGVDGTLVVKGGTKELLPLTFDGSFLR